jgi:hypothetical protein
MGKGSKAKVREVYHVEVITKARVVPENNPEDEDNTTERREARKRENKRKELRVVRESMEIIL